MRDGGGRAIGSDCLELHSWSGNSFRHQPDHLGDEHRGGNVLSVEHHQCGGGQKQLEVALDECGGWQQFHHHRDQRRDSGLLWQAVSIC